jgi:hypothetical protein
MSKMVTTPLRSISTLLAFLKGKVLAPARRSHMNCAEFLILDTLTKAGFTSAIEPIGDQGSVTFINLPWSDFSETLAHHFEKLKRDERNLNGQAEVEIFQVEDSASIRIIFSTLKVFSQFSKEQLTIHASDDQAFQTQVSRLEEGYELKFALPIQAPPLSFCSEVTLRKGAKLLLAISDNSSRFTLGKLFGGHGFRCANFADEQDSESLVLADLKFLQSRDSNSSLSNPDDRRRFIVAVKSDSEQFLLEEEFDGFRFIRLDRLEYLGIKITNLPPILDAVLVDDDKGVHLCWSLESNFYDGNYLGFKSHAAFLGAAHLIETDCPIYIDSGLGKGVKGESVARIIRGMGFETIYLQTGYSAESFNRLPWVTEILGKISHWENISANKTLCKLGVAT